MLFIKWWTIYSNRWTNIYSGVFNKRDENSFATSENEKELIVGDPVFKFGIHKYKIKT